MVGIVLTMASAGVMCAAGVGVSSALRWFHSYDITAPERKTESSAGKHPHSNRMKSLRGRINE